MKLRYYIYFGLSIVMRKCCNINPCLQYDNGKARYNTYEIISEILYPGDDNCCRCMRVEGKSCDRGWGDCDFDWECSGVRL